MGLAKELLTTSGIESCPMVRMYITGALWSAAIQAIIMDSHF